MTTTRNQRGDGLNRSTPSRRGAWRRALAALGVGAIAATSYGAVAGPAAADTTGWSFAGGATSPNGWRVGEYRSDQGQFAVCALDFTALGPGNGGAATTLGDPYPIDTVSPVVAMDGSSRPDVSGQQAAILAAALGEFGGGTEPAATDTAALKIAGTWIQGIGNSAVSAADQARADEMVAWANTHFGPYAYGNASDFVLDVASNGETGTLTIDTIGSAGGATMEGYSQTVTLSGPYTFTDGTKTTVVNSSATATTLNVVRAEEPGDYVGFTVTADGLPGGLLRMDPQVSNHQGLLISGNKTSVTTSRDPIVVPARSFQPSITSQVKSFPVSAGEKYADTFTVAIGDGERWSTRGGQPIPLIFESVLYGFVEQPVPGADIPADAQVLDRVTTTVTGTGSYDIESNITADAANGGRYAAWTTFVRVADQPADLQRFLAGDANDGYFTPSETHVVRVNPSITTERVTEFSDEGPIASLGDNVTLNLGEGQVWPKDLTGGTVAYETTGTVLFSTTPFEETPADQPAPGTPVGSATLTWTAAGSPQVAEATLTNGGVPGFYTWQWAGEQTDHFEATTTPSWEVIETTSVRHQIEHYSKVTDYNVLPGGLVFDDGIISGFPADHGSFAGIEGWAPDGAEAQAIIYGPLEQRAEGEAPADAPVWKTLPLVAQNGAWELGYEGEIQVPETTTYATGDHYVIVYSFAGDSRTAAYDSAFGDIREQFFVRGSNPVENGPKVITKAMVEAPTGSFATDDALVTGIASGKEFYLHWDAYFTPRDAAAECAVPDEATVAALIAAGPGAKVGPVKVTQDGVYTSPQVATGDSDACIWWVERLTTDREGNDPVHEGKIGNPGEVTKVVKPETPVDISTNLRHDGDPTTGPIVGDSIWDLVKNPAGALEGDVTTVTLYRSTDGSMVCTQPIWTSTFTWKAGETERETPEKFKTDVPGTYMFVEQTTREGKVISTGECGDPDETVTVKSAPTPNGGGDAVQQAGGGDDMVRTGAAVGGIVAAAIALAAGGIFLMRRRSALES